ncbi:CMRF35-like molecule 8 [Danio aesculapii]|uniref:CMRF35-like molecule 8 n=1 Tax=Danio aesculapii TaxID=1142201 RepID=UPI0024C06B0E|nr:CMRF35-like molecule 8 [Danio aesculapii]
MIHISDNKLLIFTLLILMTVVDSEMKTTFTGHEGGRVKIQCPYSESEYEGNQKYLCRGECPINPFYINKDIPVESGSAPKDERFSLTDNRTAHIFTITITDLRTADQGKYWCAVKTALLKPDDYKEIYLEIKQVSRVSGEPGKHLSITCSYTGDLKDHLRFLCKGSDPSDCKNIIKVSSETNTNGRFSLTDDSERVFTVNISNLTEEDSGIYWCGAVKNKTQEYTWISAVNLEITKATSETRLPKNTTTVSFHTSKPAETASSRPVTPSSSSSSSSSSISMFINASTDAASSKTSLGFTIIIMLMVVVMLTVFGLSLFLYLKRKQKKKGAQTKDDVYHQPVNLPNGNTDTTRQATHGVSDYEEISSSLNNPIYSSVSPAFSQQDASVYALAQLPSSPSDHLNYSTVRFSASHHSDRTSGGLDTCDYSTVNL